MHKIAHSVMTIATKPVLTNSENSRGWGGKCGAGPHWVRLQEPKNEQKRLREGETPTLRRAAED